TRRAGAGRSRTSWSPPCCTGGRGRSGLHRGLRGGRRALVARLPDRYPALGPRFPVGGPDRQRHPARRVSAEARGTRWSRISPVRAVRSAFAHYTARFDPVTDPRLRRLLIYELVVVLMVTFGLSGLYSVLD